MPAEIELTQASASVRKRILALLNGAVTPIMRDAEDGSPNVGPLTADSVGQLCRVGDAPGPYEWYVASALTSWDRLPDTTYVDDALALKANTADLGSAATADASDYVAAGTAETPAGAQAKVDAEAVLRASAITRTSPLTMIDPAGDGMLKGYALADIPNNWAASVGKSMTVLSIGSGVTTIGDYAFYECYSLNTVVISDSVTNIGSNAFDYCVGLTSVVISDSVTNIGAYAFKDCGSLTSVVISNSVTSIGAYAFQFCAALASVVIPDSVVSIGSGAFYTCLGLTSVVIPDSVTSIGSKAYYQCSISELTIGRNVATIGEYAFALCPNLTTINSYVSYGVLDGDTNALFLSGGGEFGFHNEGPIDLYVRVDDSSWTPGGPQYVAGNAQVIVYKTLAP